MKNEINFSMFHIFICLLNYPYIMIMELVIFKISLRNRVNDFGL